MDIRGDKAYLTPDEQRRSGWQSPLRIQAIDLHATRLEAEADMENYIDAMAKDGDELTHAERAGLVPAYERAAAISMITRGIAKELARRAAGDELIQQVEASLKRPD